MAAPLSGQIIRASDAFNLVEFTPVLSGTTSFAGGTGAVAEGWYVQQGDIVHWGFRYQLGTSPSLSGTLLLDLPVAAWTGGGTSIQVSCGNWGYRDTSVPAHYAGTLGIFASTGLQVAFNGAWSGTVPNTRINATQPTTIAVDDVYSGGGVYRAA